MAGFKSTYLGNLFLNALYGGAAFDSALPASLYFAAMTVAPTAAGGGTEWSDGGITRVTKTRNTTNFPTSTAALVSNATTLAFGTPVADATIIGIAVYDASSGGNLIDYAVFDVPKLAVAGVAFTMQIGSLRRTTV